MFLTYQLIDEIVQSDKPIQQALSEIVNSLTQGNYVILLHAPYDLRYECLGSIPVTAQGFRYGTIQQVKSLSVSQEFMQHIADQCGSFLAYSE